jgi:hypothetical protein
VTASDFSLALARQWIAANTGWWGAKDEASGTASLAALIDQVRQERDAELTKAQHIASLAASEYARGLREGMERAAVIAGYPYGDLVAAMGADEPSMVGKKISAAIRAAATAPAPEDPNAGT